MTPSNGGGAGDGTTLPDGAVPGGETTGSRASANPVATDADTAKTSMAASW